MRKYQVTTIGRSHETEEVVLASQFHVDNGSLVFMSEDEDEIVAVFSSGYWKAVWRINDDGQAKPRSLED